MTSALARLTQAGVSVWLDDLSRHRLTSGSLAALIADRHVTGVTTNPSIFAAAVSGGVGYGEQLAELAANGADPVEAVTALTATDVIAACDLFAGVHTVTGGLDGRVSLEVDPTLAHDATSTVAEARRLAALVDRPNLLVKIPATEAGLPAIADTLAAGISVNVTLIFAADRYRQVLDAWADGCERGLAAGVPPNDLVSVASFFVSRVDTAVDAALVAIGTDEALALRGGAAVANARVAHGVFREFMGSPRVAALLTAGVRPQRPLWASTGVKNPDYESTRYVDQLVTAGVVNTMPEPTLDEVAAHGGDGAEVVVSGHDQALAHLDALAAVGVDLSLILKELEKDGVAAFVSAWEQLLDTVATGLGAAR